MQYCSACQTALASVVILDLDDGAVTGSQHLCPTCAEQLGVAQPKTPPKFSAEILEDLLGGLQAPGAGSAAGSEAGNEDSAAETGSAGKPRRGAARQQADACPGCGMTVSEFRSKGRLGCPRCYETYRNDLVPLLQRIHEAQSHRGRLPGRLAAAPPATDERDLAQLRQRLEDAVRGERYEEAAKLRDDLRRLERGESSEGTHS
ncbi:MAG: UvrB/UvrC motif-containing protein [bacterium]|nr:UvrB/UvrC motif-containing protein [bacterium]